MNVHDVEIKMSISLYYKMYYKDSHLMNCCLNIDLGHVDSVYLFCAYFYLFTLSIMCLLILNINVLGLIHTISYCDTINLTNMV